MKSAYFALVVAASFTALFFMSTCIFPYELGWSGELLVGFYQFEVVTYDVVDYDEANSVWVYHRRGDTRDFIKYIIGLEDHAKFGMDRQNR